jgi:hypothetical protein
MIRRTFALLLVALAGCSTSIDAADYDQTCQAATDCRAIFTGDVCDCGCSTAAINVADYTAYVDDRGSPSCSTDCEPCPAPVEVCTMGVCGVQ